MMLAASFHVPAKALLVRQSSLASTLFGGAGLVGADTLEHQYPDNVS